MEVIFCTFAGTLFILDGKDGSMISSFNYKSHVFTTTIVVDVHKAGGSEVMAGTYGGELFALNVSGVKRRVFALRRSAWARSTG